MRKEAWMRKFVRMLSGKSIETKIEEYSEVYGDILLGIHRDTQMQKKPLTNIRQTLIPN